MLADVLPPNYTCKIVATDPHNGCSAVDCLNNCKTTCGKKYCCEGEYCADAKRSLCCKNGEDKCQLLAPAGSPSTGKEPARCCPQETRKCCANDKRMACCKDEDSCCAGQCCPPEKRCTKGVCACPKGKATCGRHCCDKERQKCCTGPDKHCCKAAETCCGGGCCPTDRVCAKRAGVDVCCPKGSVFNAPGKTRFCCPPGTVPATNGCCAPGTPDCCIGDAQNLPPLPQAGKVCVNGVLVGI